MHRVFADRAPRVPLVSVKPIYGHLLGASSALNVAATTLMLHHGWLAPTLNIDPARAGGAGVLPRGIDHAGGGGRPCDASAALAVSYGIGGHNAVTLVGKAGAA